MPALSSLVLFIFRSLFCTHCSLVARMSACHLVSEFRMHLGPLFVLSPLGFRSCRPVGLVVLGIRWFQVRFPRQVRTSGVSYAWVDHPGFVRLESYLSRQCACWSVRSGTLGVGTHGVSTFVGCFVLFLSRFGPFSVLRLWSVLNYYNSK